MKQFKSFLLITLAVVGFMSCQKDEGVNSITGTWEGKWGFDFDTPTHFEKWEIKKGGEFLVYNSAGTKIGVGTWDADGFNFEAEYTHVGSDESYSYSGLYSDVGEEIIGNWGETPSSTDGGTFEMYKK